MTTEDSGNMKKTLDYMKKPRNIYFSIILMLTLVTGLVSISFSYYVNESNDNKNVLKLSKVDNRVQSDYLQDGIISIKGNEILSFKVYVISNNNFESIYKLFYKTKNKDIKVYKDESKDTIGANDVHEINITIENISTKDEDVQIGIVSGYVGSELVLENPEIIKQ